MVRRPTAQDVADLAGVSRSAVSLVLNGHGDGNISPAKQAAVRRAARELRYTPNALALGLRSRQSRLLGVLVWGGPRTEVWTILHAALRAATGSGYLLLIMDADGDPQTMTEAIETLRARQVDGFLVIAPERQAYRPGEVPLGAPTVLANCSDPAQAVPSVTSDDDDPGALAAVGEQAVRLLVEQIVSGHRSDS